MGRCSCRRRANLVDVQHEAAAILHLNIKTVYAAIEAGSIKAVRFGRTIRIPKDQFANLGAQ